MLSLEKNIRTCKVDTSWANRIQSNRFENPELMLCPLWGGFDNTGRPVSADTFYTKSAGCNSSEDRLLVENALRPQYFQYVNLDAEGVNGNIYGSSTDNNMFRYDTNVRNDGLSQLNPNLTGQWSNAPDGSNIYPRCTSYPYELAQNQKANVSRNAQFLQHASRNNGFKNNAGF